MTHDEAKAKVAKLMALGTNEAANENEAEAALRQAAYLIRVHNIEQAEIQNSTGADVVFEWQEVNVPLDPKRHAVRAVKWMGRIALGIARFTDCMVDYNRVDKYGLCLRFRGEMVDVSYAVYLMKHLRDTIIRMGADYCGSRKQREDYKYGIVDGLNKRMHDSKASMMSGMKDEANAACSTALIIFDRKQIELAARYGKMRVVHTRDRGRSAYAFTEGREVSKSIGFGRPLSGPAAQRALCA